MTSLASLHPRPADQPGPYEYNGSGPRQIRPAPEPPDPAPTFRDKITGNGLLIITAALLLAALAAAMGIVSWRAQYSFIYAIKHQQIAATLEALGLDAGAVIFSVLGISLARLGRRAIIERALVCICAAGSCAMNAAGADLGSPRSVAAFLMPPLLFAITSDRLISVIRRSALGPKADADAQRSAWRTGGVAFLYVLRLIVAPPSTVRGARAALLQATPLPDTPKPAAVGTLDSVGTLGGRQDKPSRQVPAPRPRKAIAGPSKASQLLAIAAERHDLATVGLDRVSKIATEIAQEISYSPQTARRVLLDHVRQVQAPTP